MTIRNYVYENTFKIRFVIFELFQESNTFDLLVVMSNVNTQNHSKVKPAFGKIKKKREADGKSERSNAHSGRRLGDIASF